MEKRKEVHEDRIEKWVPYIILGVAGVALTNILSFSEGESRVIQTAEEELEFEGPDNEFMFTISIIIEREMSEQGAQFMEL